MTNKELLHLQELARLRLIQREVQQKAQQVMVRLGWELDSLDAGISERAFSSKKQVLAGLIDLYLEHLRNLKQKNLSAADKLIAADLQRWSILKGKVLALRKQEILSFKASLSKELKNLAFEINTILNAVENEIEKRKKA